MNDSSRVSDQDVERLTERLNRLIWPQPLDLEALAEHEPQPPQ